MGEKQKKFSIFYDNSGFGRLIWWILVIMQMGGLMLLFITTLYEISLLLLIVSGFGYYMDHVIRDKWYK